MVEDEVQCAAEDGLDATDLVTATEQVVEGADDGETGADIRFEEEAGVVFPGQVFQVALVAVYRRTGDLVTGHHRDAFLQEGCLAGGD